MTGVDQKAKWVTQLTLRTCGRLKKADGTPILCIRAGVPPLGGYWAMLLGKAVSIVKLIAIRDQADLINRPDHTDHIISFQLLILSPSLTIIRNE